MRFRPPRGIPVQAVSGREALWRRSGSVVRSTAKETANASERVELTIHLVVSFSRPDKLADGTTASRTGKRRQRRTAGPSILLPTVPTSSATPTSTRSTTSSRRASFRTQTSSRSSRTPRPSSSLCPSSPSCGRTRGAAKTRTSSSGSRRRPNSCASSSPKSGPRRTPGSSLRSHRSGVNSNVTCSRPSSWKSSGTASSSSRSRTHSRRTRRG